MLNPLAEYAENRRVKPRTFTITERDFELVQWSAKHLATSNSEVVRTAIRSLATRLAEINAEK